MKKALIAILAIFLIHSSMMAQKKINNVIKVNPSNIRAIKGNNDVKGYYMFYKADKLKSKDYSYKLVIFDENTEKVATKTLIASKYFHLLESSYNQNRLCFKFYDVKEKMVSLIFYDNEGNKVDTEKYEARKIEKKMILFSINGETKMTPSIIPVGNIGFLEYRMVKNNSDGYILTYYSNDGKKSSWETKSDENAEESQTLGPLSATEDLVTSLLATKPSRMSRDIRFFVVGTDITNGKETFRYEVKSSKYQESPINAIYNKKTNKINLLSYYFSKDENMMNGRSIGIANTELSTDGKELSKKYISWKKDVASTLAVNQHNKFDDIGFLFFHEFVRAENGKIYGIGESFRRANKGSNTALKALAAASGDASGLAYMTVEIGDFYLFEFDSEFNFQKVEIVEKSASKYDLPAWGAAPIMLGYVANAYGCFDFSGLKTINQGKSFVLFYQNYEKRKKEKNRSVAGVISNTGGEYVTDKLDIDTEADFIRVLPAQGANILFVEFFKKEKRIEMNMKKMNY
tara:strand:+ start:6 stop:1556 length:1551 start_codon:yes stop_codon:yes gene_type:complete